MEDRLHKFARLVDKKSFTRAAADLHISQPALSSAIKKLERELGAELIIRSSHSFALTPAGEIAYSAAKELTVHGQNLKTALATIAKEKVPLHLGMIDSIATMLFVHHNALGNLEENASVSLNIDNSSRLTKFVSRDELDMAFVTQPKTLDPSLQQQELGTEPLILVASPTQTPQVLRDLKQHKLERFLSYNHNSQTHKLIQKHFSEQHITLKPIFYSTHPEVTLQLVLADRGITVLPYLLVKPYIAQNKLVPIALGGSGSSIIARDISIVRRSKRQLPEQATQLIAEAQHQLRQLMHDAEGINFL